MTLFYSLLSLLAVFIFILLSALCSASEAAVLAASRVRLYHLAKNGNAKASLIINLQAHIGGFISSIILLNTWFNTLVTALATGILTYFFGAMGALYAAIGMGAIITVYGEVLPKMYVYTCPDRVAIRFAPFFKPLLSFMTPLTKAINFLAHGSLFIFGIKSYFSLLFFLFAPISDLKKIHLFPLVILVNLCRNNHCIQFLSTYFIF